MKKSASQHFQMTFRISSLLLLLLNACGSQNSEPMSQAHQVDSAAKTAPQKLRQACISQVKDTTIHDRAGVSICTFNPAIADPTKQYSLMPLDRKMKLAHATAKNNVVIENVTITAGVSFFGKTTMPIDAQKDMIVAAIHDDCYANMQYFWSKSDVLLDLQLARAVSGNTYDQTLSLEYSPLSVATSHSPTADAIDFQLQIEEWGHGTIQFSTSVADCNDAAKASKKLPSGVEEDRSACRKKSNQQFCLAFNKMVGHWMGAVDKTDLHCYPSTAATTPAKATAPPPVSTDTTTPLASFMSFLVNPVAAVPVTAPVVTAPTKTAEEIQKDLLDKVHLVDAITQPASTDDLTMAPNRTLTTTPTPIVDDVQDQSGDPSYEKWLGYEVTKDDLGTILKCDYTRAEEVVAKNRQTPTADNKTTAPVRTNNNDRVDQNTTTNSK